jgi:hypothetical protein
MAMMPRIVTDRVADGAGAAYVEWRLPLIVLPRASLLIVSGIVALSPSATAPEANARCGPPMRPGVG